MSAQQKTLDDVDPLDPYDGKVDYLKDDPIIADQQFYCVSFVEPHEETVALKMKFMFAEYLRYLMSEEAKQKREAFCKYNTMSDEDKEKERVIDGGDKYQLEVDNWISNEMERLTLQFKKAYPDADRPTVRGVKVRGSYSSYKMARKRADRLKDDDQSFNIFVGEVGKWCP
jgi:hypothetical protein